MKSTLELARPLCRMAVPLLAASLLTGCGATSGPIHVPPLPSASSRAEPSGSATVSGVAGQSISNELDQMRNMMAETSPGVARARQQVLQVHNFPEGTSLRRVFLSNNLFARFDPDLLGFSRMKSPIFFATAGDIMDYLQNVLNLYVRVEGSGTFIISRCVERAYSVPPNAGVFFSVARLRMLKSDIDGRSTYVPTGVLYVYDDHTGQSRVRAYVKSLRDLKDNQQAWSGLKPALQARQEQDEVSALHDEVNTLRTEIATLKKGDRPNFPLAPDDPPSSSPEPEGRNYDSPIARNAPYFAHAGNNVKGTRPRSTVSPSEPPASSAYRSGTCANDPPPQANEDAGAWRVYLTSTIFRKQAAKTREFASRKLSKPVYVFNDRKRHRYSIFCSADSPAQARKLVAAARKLGYHAYFAKLPGAAKAVTHAAPESSRYSAKAQRHTPSKSGSSIPVQPVHAPVIARPAPPPAPTWTLQQGTLIGKVLDAWAKKAGWTVVWQLTQDWSVPSSTTLSGDFKAVVTKVVTALAKEGVDIHAVFHSNNTVVISGTGN